MKVLVWMVLQVDQINLTFAQMLWTVLVVVVVVVGRVLVMCAFCQWYGCVTFSEWFSSEPLLWQT